MGHTPVGRLGGRMWNMHKERPLSGQKESSSTQRKEYPQNLKRRQGGQQQK